MSEKVLSYDEIDVGREFDPPPYTLTTAAVEKYIQAVEDNNPIHRDEKAAREDGLPGIVVPPTTAAIYTRTSPILQREGKMPPGAIHARQEYHFLAPVQPGETLTTKGKVVEKFIRKERKWMVIESTTYNQRGEAVVFSRMTGIWPS